MINYLTHIAKQTEDLPSDYEFQKTALERGLLTTQKERQQFQRVEAGMLGENQLNKWLNEFGKSHWVCLRNIWLKTDNPFECDMLVITHHGSYLFEIKNYFGKFVYEKGRSISRGVPITYNPINQARNATLHLQNITQSLAPTLPVRGVLAFMGEHNHVEIKDELTDIDVLRRSEVYQYIQNMITTENVSRNLVHPEKLLAHYESYEIEKPYRATPYTRTHVKKVKKGILCGQCGQPVRLKKGNYLPCPCGFHEAREAAIIRTACEYGVLTFGTNFTPQAIHTFLGPQISLNNVKKILLKHFEVVTGAKTLTFYNRGRLMTYLPHAFTFDLPNIYHVRA